MPKAVAKMAPRQSRPGSTSVAEARGRNIRMLRALQGLSQFDLADRMAVLVGPNWSRVTVSEVETAGRSCTDEELVGLALALDTTVAELLDPTSGGRVNTGLDLPGLPRPIGAEESQLWLQGQATISLSWEPGTEAEQGKRPVGRYRDMGLTPRPGQDMNVMLRALFEDHRRRRAQEAEQHPISEASKGGNR